MRTTPPGPVKPEPRRTSDATIAQLRAWYESRFAQSPQVPPVNVIVASGPTGQTVLIDIDTGEVVA